MDKTKRRERNGGVCFPTDTAARPVCTALSGDVAASYFSGGGGRPPGTRSGGDKNDGGVESRFHAPNGPTTAVADDSRAVSAPGYGKRTFD